MTPLSGEQSLLCSPDRVAKGGGFEPPVRFSRTSVFELRRFAGVSGEPFAEREHAAEIPSAVAKEPGEHMAESEGFEPPIRF
ncbi:MAG: hypothetical protein WAK22_05900, partial [Candidatus Sulfotelmatobacter sp.]